MGHREDGNRDQGFFSLTLGNIPDISRLDELRNLGQLRSLQTMQEELKPDPEQGDSSQTGQGQHRWVHVLLVWLSSRKEYRPERKERLRENPYTKLETTIKNHSSEWRNYIFKNNNNN